tara:strand:+ start:126 stop:617 length:492 start_codon:yes stop_codon:yes gene_type:complete
MNCSRCNIKVPQGRIDMGYTICTDCSTEEKVSCHTIYPHKTGGYIQVVSKEASDNLNRLDRRGTSVKVSKHYKPFVVEKKEEPKPFSNRRCTKVYTEYDVALKKVLDYYDEWGYEPTLKYIRTMNSSGDIPLMTRIKIQDMVTEIYLTPTPRALVRKFNKGIV